MWWFQDSTKPSRYTAGLFYVLFVLELCSDKKGHKKTSIKLRFCGILAEKEGFEPPLAFTKTVFKTAAFNRSAISPYILLTTLSNIKLLFA